MHFQNRLSASLGPQDRHDHAYAERAMVKSAERAETTQVQLPSSKRVLSLGAYFTE